MREAELSPDHCPNCGRPLKFPADQTEGLCSSCGIFVEILTPLPKPGSMGLARENVIAATRRELERLCREHGLVVAGKKADLIARLIEYIDRQGSQPQPVSERREEPQSPAASGLDDIAKRAELALLFLNLEQVLNEPDETDDIKEEDRAASSEPAPKPAAEVEIAPPSPQPLSEPPQPPEATSREELPPPLFAESSAEEVGELSGDLADVETFAPAPEVHPPEPPSEAEAQGEAVVAEPAPHVETAGRSEPTSEVQSGPAASRLRLDRAVFYIGAVHVAVGGAAFLLGSLLHDMFRVPFFGDAYEAFGSLNVAAALIGVILALAGIGAMAIGLRGGVIRARPVAEA